MPQGGWDGRRAIKSLIRIFGRQEVQKETGIDLSTKEFDPYRREGLKALGNAIVPQVALEIFKAIDYHD